ncbi:MAG TPA: hypothetical protein VF315_07050 [Steroidobacteraceae bacterium]
MRSLKELGFLKLAFSSERPAPVEDGRVVELFRNRAELKKAYGEVQTEIHRLKDRLKQQEGATLRVQEMLEVLETRLTAEDTAYPAIVFYHLRAMWQFGRELLERQAGEVGRQYEEHERKQHFAECNRRLFGQRQAIEAQLRAAEADAADASQQLADLARERARLTRFWHYFKRRDLDSRAAATRTVVAARNAALLEARSAFEVIENTPPEEFPGLSIEARRAINLTAIAYAEVLCLRLAKTRLVQLAKEAMGRRESSEQYGSRAQCEGLIADIARARALLQQRADGGPQEIKARIERLRSIARYRDPADTVPVEASLSPAEGDALAHPAQGASAAQLPNVLSEDTWDLFKVLLR